MFPNLTHVSIGPKQEQSVAPILREVTPASPATQMVTQVPTFTVQAASGVTLSKDASAMTVDLKPTAISSNNVVTNNSTTTNSLTMQIPFLFPQG